MSHKRYFKTIFGTVILSVLILAIIWARVLYGSMAAFKEGETLLEKKDYIGAITYFDRSMHWYTPFSPYVCGSAKRLWQISRDAEAGGDIRLALIAVRTIRRGFISARSFYVPGRDWILKCDSRIHALGDAERDGTSAREEKDILSGAILNHPQVKGPDVFWSVALLIGFLGWIASVIAFIASGLRKSQRDGLSKPTHSKWIITWAVFFAIWILGMIKA